MQTGCRSGRWAGIALIYGAPQRDQAQNGDQGSDDPDDYMSYEHRRSDVICLRGGLEMEIAQLDEEEAALSLAEYGITEPGLHRMIRLSYGLVGLQSFFPLEKTRCEAGPYRWGRQHWRRVALSIRI